MTLKKNITDNSAWAAQSQSLIRVQAEGTQLEKKVREILGWDSGVVGYDQNNSYSLQVDAVYPDKFMPRVAVSVTYTNPDTRGHSNENKLQLKIGELALLKFAYPSIRVVLVIGGSKDAWLSYVLEAFVYFFDEVIFLWTATGIERLGKIKESPESVPLTNQDFWDSVRAERNSIATSRPTQIPNSLIRYQIADILKAQTPIVYNPSLIENEIARHCMRASFNRGGREWQNYLAGNWFSIEMSRNYFNPLEAIVEIILQEMGFDYEGGMAQDVEVQSLLHDFGMLHTSVSEDFVLFSERFNVPVYIQCKASGGGRSQHGKNIQNRTKEQTTRGILYRARFVDNRLIWKPKHFHWISVLDGNWGVSAKQPYKYLDMLQLAGYDMIFPASELITDSFQVNRKNNPLGTYLNDYLKCRLKKTLI